MRPLALALLAVAAVYLNGAIDGTAVSLVQKALTEARSAPSWRP